MQCGAFVVWQDRLHRRGKKAGQPVLTAAGAPVRDLVRIHDPLAVAMGEARHDAAAQLCGGNVTVELRLDSAGDEDFSSDVELLLTARCDRCGLDHMPLLGSLFSPDLDAAGRISAFLQRAVDKISNAERAGLIIAALSKRAAAAAEAERLRTEGARAMERLRIERARRAARKALKLRWDKTGKDLFVCVGVATIGKAGKGDFRVAPGERFTRDGIAAPRGSFETLREAQDAVADALLDAARRA